MVLHNNKLIGYLVLYRQPTASKPNISNKYSSKDKGGGEAIAMRQGERGEEGEAHRLSTDIVVVDSNCFGHQLFVVKLNKSESWDDVGRGTIVT